MEAKFTPDCFSFFRFHIVLALLILTSATLPAQQPRGFCAHDVFQSTYFLENNNMMPDYEGQPIRYFSNHDLLKGYFTGQGVLYRLDKKRIKVAKGVKDNDDMENETFIAKSSLFNLKWLNANPHPVIRTGQKSVGYYTFLKTAGKSYTTLKTRGYKTVTYEELYPGIDLQFSIPDKGGIKYALILHPGADINAVKFVYSGDITTLVKNKTGDLVIETGAGEAIDHAPVSCTENGKKVESSYDMVAANDGYHLRFSLPGGYDHSETLTVDPWIQATSFASSNCAMDVDYDSVGNTLVYGAGPTSDLDASEYYELSRYNPSGVVQWTFSGNITSIGWNSFSASNGNTNYAGNILVDKSTGKTYMSKGHDGTATTVVRIDTSGNYDNFITTTNTNFQEAWGLKYNCIDSTLLAVGGGPSSDINMALINTHTGAIDTANITHTGSSGHQDIAGAAFDNFGNLYVVMVSGSGANLPYSNTVYRVDPGLHNYTWDAEETRNSLTEEYQQPYWNNDLPGSSNWANLLAANSSYLYYWDGLYLDAFNLNTGAAAGSTVVLGFIALLKQQGGIAVDNCNNIYAGGDDGVIKAWSFNGSTFTSLADIDLPGAYSQDNTQDVKYNSNNNMLYLAGGGNDGNSFVGTMVATYSTGCSLIGTSHTCDSATVHVSPTTGTIFNYTWTDSTGTVVGQLTGSTDTINGIGNLNAGKYFISVQGQSNCNGSALLDSVILNGGSATITARDTLCTASATVNPTGTGPFTYLWSNSSTAQTINNLSTGTYKVTVTASGCTTSASALVNAPTAINATGQSTNTACGSNGTATVNISTGTGPFTYLWNNSDTAKTISVGVGTYTVIVTGSAGCTATASATVLAGGSNLTLNLTSTGAGCVPNGTATATVTAGTGPFTYAWNNGPATQTDSNLAAGTYHVTVTGAGGCSATDSVAVTSSGGGLTLATAFNNATCGQSNGSAGVTVLTGNSPFTYSWNNGGTHDTIAGVGPGTYSVTVTGADGCVANTSVTIGSTNSLSISAISTAASCNTSNGTATATVITGTPPYTYLWSNTDTGAAITGLSSGVYSITATSLGGCTAETSVTVSSTNGVTLAAASVNTSCGNNNGIAIALVTTGTGPYSYHWSNNASTDTITGLGGGTYSVTVTDAHACSSTASAVVAASTPVAVNINSNKTIMCPGDSAQLCATTAFAVYAWSDGETTQCIVTTYSGNYNLTVTDINQCTALSNSIDISNYAPTPVTISVNGDTLTSYPAETYQWYLNSTVLPGDTFQTLVTTETGTYTLVIKDGHGCYYTSTPTKVSGINSIIAGEIKVYPNPLISGNWHVDITPDLIGAWCEVLDIEGRVIYREQLRNEMNEIAPEIASGVYIMRICYASEAMNLKLIKM